MWNCFARTFVSDRTAAGESNNVGKRYYGLKNQGATCYLNTVLQCLYMTEDFRHHVENFTEDSEVKPGGGALMKELQNVFTTLKEAVGTTNRTTQCLSITNVFEQQDAVEYYQKILKTVGPPACKVFQGELSNNSRCPTGHLFEEKCPFITIPLAIEAESDKVYNVREGLGEFLKPRSLDEENWMYCEQCDQKTETEIWTEIKDCPTILTLYVKRFDFDYMQMTFVKNNSLMHIPESLCIKQCNYDLYAVINHMGSRSGGHYNALIKSFEDKNWYCFDDSTVTKESFDSLQNSRQAYVLMYKKRLYKQAKFGWKTIVPAGILTGIAVFCIIRYLIKKQ